MNKHIITALLILTCASAATAMRGPRTRPSYIHKQAPTAVAAVDSHATSKSTSRTPNALRGLKSTNKASSSKLTRKPRHHASPIQHVQ